MVQHDDWTSRGPKAGGAIVRHNYHMQKVGMQVSDRHGSLMHVSDGRHFSLWSFQLMPEGFNRD